MALNRKNILPFALAGIFIVYLLMKVLGVIANYKIPTSAMEPTYNVGKFIVATNLLGPKVNDIVTYESKTIGVEGRRPSEKGIFIGRIVGKGNELLELKDGYVYIDGKMNEQNLNLKFSYKFNKDQIKENRTYINQLHTHDRMMINDGEIIFLDDNEKKKYIGNENFRKIDNKFQKEIKYGIDIQDDWTHLNYGPIKVPKDYFFILGDHRSNSEDSRMRGFIHKDEITGVVIN